MNMNNIKKLLNIQSIMCAITALLLLLALDRHPHGFYTILRLVTFITGGYVAWLAFRSTKLIWSVVFGISAILFNPVIPIYLSRSTWRPIDIGASILFAVGIIVSASFHNGVRSTP